MPESHATGFEPETNRPDAEGAVVRILVSLIVLALFFGGLLYDYWLDLLPAAYRAVNSARSVGAKPVESQYFEVKNNSKASDSQVRMVVRQLETQYEAITQYLKVTPANRLQVLFVNGQGPLLIDGAQLVVNYDNGLIDIDLAPFFLVMLVEGNNVDLQKGLTPAGGHALQVVEGAKIGEFLLRRPLDEWVALLRKHDAYIPLEEAWTMGLPSDENSAYNLLRALLESGSFLRWLADQKGLEATQQVARGEPLEVVTGRSLAENESAWLKALDEQKIETTDCNLMTSRGSFLSLICGKIDEASH